MSVNLIKKGGMTMTIGTRIKKIRKDNGLNQADFAKRINISRSNLSNLEIERVSLTDRVLKSICVEFNINESWLRDGIGEMQSSSPKKCFSLDDYAKQNNMTELDIEIIKLYFSLDVETRTTAMNFFKENMLKPMAQKMASSISETAPQGLVKQNVNNTEFATVEEAEEAYKKSRLNSASKMTSSVTSSTNDSVNLKVVK